MKLRAYQEQAIEEITDSFKAHDRVLYTLPTGGGKTVIFSELTKRFTEKGKSVLILVHRNELLNQSSKALTSRKIEHGIVTYKKTLHTRK